MLGYVRGGASRRHVPVGKNYEISKELCDVFHITDDILTVAYDIDGTYTKAPQSWVFQICRKGNFEKKINVISDVQVSHSMGKTYQGGDASRSRDSVCTYQSLEKELLPFLNIMNYPSRYLPAPSEIIKLLSC